jgi:predicted alpha/beta-hydrolase family hydrolase
MMQLLRNGTGGTGTIILAHGAGAGMDTPFMEAFAAGLADRGFQVVRFNFPYMVKRMEDGKKRPPDRAPKLLEAYAAVINTVRKDAPLIIGGKSMGGRIASMLAAENTSLSLAGLVCLGYPFHPPGKPDRLRVEHLPAIPCKTLIAQGERDPFGGTALVDTLQLPKQIQLHWAPDGNHDLSPRKASGHTAEGNWAAAMDAIAATFT